MPPLPGIHKWITCQTAFPSTSKRPSPDAAFIPEAILYDYDYAERARVPTNTSILVDRSPILQGHRPRTTTR
jgi:hypothetical protein